MDHILHIVSENVQVNVYSSWKCRHISLYKFCHLLYWNTFGTTADKDN